MTEITPPRARGLTVRSFLWGLIQYCIQSFVARSAPVDPEQDEKMVRNMVSLYLEGLLAEPRPGRD